MNLKCFTVICCTEFFCIQMFDMSRIEYQLNIINNFSEEKKSILKYHKLYQYFYKLLISLHYHPLIQVIQNIN